MDNSINKLALAITTIIFAGMATADVTPQGTGATSDASSVAIGDNASAAIHCAGDRGHRLQR